MNVSDESRKNTMNVGVIVLVQLMKRFSEVDPNTTGVIVYEYCRYFC